MTFYIVNTETGRAWGKAYWTKQEYTTERGAKIACTKMNKSAVADGHTAKFTVVDRTEYDSRPVTMVERVNLMSGEKYMEAEDTPNFMSPASEAYWSS